MKTMTRRSFLQKSSLVVAAATVSGKLVVFNAYADQAPATYQPSAFVEIGEDGAVTVWVGQSNLGQGSQTGLAMIIAEELDADWTRVDVRMAPAAEEFKNPVWGVQVTGGSSSIRHQWDRYRKAGAAARVVLVETAAARWGCDVADCSAEGGEIVHRDGRRLPYGSLVAEASTRDAPTNPPLKAASEFGVVGTHRMRLDMEDKVAGRAVYGMDVRVEGMRFAVVARPPRYGATPTSHDTDAVRAVPGVTDVVELDGRIAVVATSTWAAMQGRDKLGATWSEGSYPDLSDASLDALFAASLDEDGARAESRGDAEAALAEATQTVDAEYSFPYLAHAPLEPINCTAHVEAGRCRVWVPTQGQTAAHDVTCQITGLSPAQVEVMTTMVGGGFGLRSEPDPVVDAVELSKELGIPIQVVRTREDDFAQDYFRPASRHRVRAGIDAAGDPVAWFQKVAAPSIAERLSPGGLRGGVDGPAVQGIPDMPYGVPNRRVEYVKVDTGIPVGYWRSVGYSFTVFTVETMIDELARLAERDPVEYRLTQMREGSRTHDVLSLLKEKSGWGSPVPEGRGRGVAVTACFGGAAAQMAEVSVDRGTGRVKVHRIVSAVDCGPVVNPDAVVAQAEGGVVMGLSQAFHERVRFADGGVATRNFDQYPILTMSEVPEVEVHLAESRHPIGGVGEPVLPAVAPAVANAVFDVVGVRLRTVPFERAALRG